MTPHLSEEQIEEALMGCLAEEPGLHLAACAPCEDRVAAARLPLENFSTLSLAWSERRSATMPVPRPTGLLDSLGHRRRLGWGVAVVALLAVLITTPLELRHSNRAAASDAAQMHSESALGTTGVVSGQSSTQQEIESDNQLLNEIDRELNTSSESPAALGLQTVRARTNHHTAARAVRD